MKPLLLALLLAMTMPGDVTESTAMGPTINEVKTKHEAQLLAVDGVVSVGIGRDADGQAIIVIGIESSNTLKQAGLPTELEGYRVKTQVIGPVKAQ